MFCPKVLYHSLLLKHVEKVHQVKKEFDKFEEFDRLKVLSLLVFSKKKWRILSNQNVQPEVITKQAIQQAATLNSDFLEGKTERIYSISYSCLSAGKP